MAEIASLKIKVDTTDLTKADRALDKTVSASKRVEASNKSLQRSFDGLKTSIIALGSAYLGAQGVGALIRIGDEYSNLNAKLRLTADSTEEFAANYKQLFELSQQTGSSFVANAQNFANMALALEATNIQSEEMLKIFETVNKSLVVAGASTEEASSFMLQFRQAMGAGVLQGEEFNAMMESNAFFGIQLAKALGTDIAGMREMREQGLLTTDAIRSAIPKMFEEIDEKFRQMPITVQRAMAELNNAFGDVFSNANTAAGGTTSLADAIHDLAVTIMENKETISDVFAGLINASQFAVERIANIANAIMALKTVAIEEDISILDWIGADTEDIKRWNQEYGRATSDIRDNLESVRQEIEAVQGSFGKWSDKREKINALREKEAELNEQLNQALRGQDAAMNAQAETIETQLLPAKTALTKADLDATKAAEKAAKAAEKAKAKAEKDALKALQKEEALKVKIVKDFEEEKAKARADISDRTRKLALTDREYKKWALEQELKDLEQYARDDKEFQDLIHEYRRQKEMEAIGEIDSIRRSMTDKVNSLTMSEKEYKDWALKEEVKSLRKYAGEVQDIQQLITKYEKEELRRRTLQYRLHIDAQESLQRTLSMALKGEFDDIGDAWDSLMDSMLDKLADVAAEMAINWATSKVGDLFEGWEFFHSGIWNLKDDEVPSILQRGEMVIPREQAEEIRQNFDGIGSGGPGSFNSLVAATAHANPDNWGGAGTFGKHLGREYGFDMASAMAAIASGIAPSAVAGAFFGVPNTLGNINDAMAKSLTDATNLRGAYADTGKFFGKAISILGLAGSAPMAASFAKDWAGMLGAYLGDKVGDLFDDRENERMRDMLEDGLITPAEYESRTSAAQSLFSSESKYGGSKFGGFIGAFSEAIQATQDFMAGIVNSIAGEGYGGRDPGWSGAQSFSASENAYAGTIGGSQTDQAGWSGSQSFSASESAYSGSIGGTGSSGSSDSGIGPSGTGAGMGPGLAKGGVVGELLVPQGDDGYAALQFGEGVLTRKAMDTLTRMIQTGELANAGNRGRDESAMMIAYLSKIYAKLNKFDNDGMPQERNY